jgi:hypothetical protein
MSNGHKLGNLIQVCFILPTFYPTFYCIAQKARYHSTLHAKSNHFSFLRNHGAFICACYSPCSRWSRKLQRSPYTEYVISFWSIRETALMLTWTLVDLLRANDSRSEMLSPKQNMPMLKQQPCINNWRPHLANCIVAESLGGL